MVGTLGRGGAERQLVYMLSALQKSGITSRVLCLTKGESFEREIEALNVPIEWVGKPNNRVMRLAKIINNLRKDPADIIHSSHFYTNIYVGLAGKILRTPSIGAVRSDLHSEIKLHKFLGGWQVSLPSFLIVNSELARTRAINHGIAPGNIEFLRNVIETKSVKKKNLPKSGSSINLLFVGRLDKNKRPERFVHLAAILLKKFPKVSLKFQIAGDGELRADLERLAESLSLSSEILEFLGVCSDMSSVYNRADILISTSEREGTSNVILEAMAHGLPVIATKVGGTAEILNESRGILIDPDNESELVGAAVILISDQNLRNSLGAEGRKYVIGSHSLEFLRKQLVSIYENLLPNRQINLDLT